MKAKVVAGIVLLLASFLLANGVQAMSSSNYRLEWFVPLTGSGGPMSSVVHKVNLTVGQTVIGDSSSPSYRVQLGYWAGVVLSGRTYLPIVMRN